MIKWESSQQEPNITLYLGNVIVTFTTLTFVNRIERGDRGARRDRSAVIEIKVYRVIKIHGNCYDRVINIRRLIVLSVVLFKLFCDIGINYNVTKN